MFLPQSKHQHGANRNTGLFSSTKNSLISTCGTFKNLFQNEYSHHRRLRAAEFLGKMSVTEVLHSATFFADMALAMLSFYLQSSSC